MVKEADLRFGERIRELQYSVPRRDQFHSDWVLYEAEAKLNLVNKAFLSVGVTKKPEEIVQFLMNEGELRSEVVVYDAKTHKPSMWESQDQFTDYQKVHDQFLRRILSDFFVKLGVTNSEEINSNAALVSIMGQELGAVDENSDVVEMSKATNMPGVTLEIVVDRDKINLDTEIDVKTMTLRLTPAAYTAGRD